MRRGFNRGAVSTLVDAIQVIGGTPTARISWLEDFVRRDLSEARTRESCAIELTAFVIQYSQQIGHYGVCQGLNLHEENIEPIQLGIREFLGRISPPVSIPHVVAAYADALEPKGRLGLVTREPVAGSVVQAVSALLLEGGRRLGRCVTPTCGRLFIGTKVSQKRCRANCGVTERVRAWREANPIQVSDRRHARYARKVRTRLPGAKVTRRKKKGA